MSRKKQIFLLVEGRVNDRPFYERILSSVARSQPFEYDVRLVEDLSLDGRNGGGKIFALALFDVFEKEHLNVQVNSVGKRRICFALDKDFDDFSGTARSSDLIIYTEAADVEAEIFRAGKIRRSLSSTFSITSYQARQVVPKGNIPVDDLARHWEQWITLRAMACHCTLPDAPRFGGLSQIHVDSFGAPDQAAELALKKRVELHATKEGKLADLHGIHLDIKARIAGGRSHELIKGKWLAQYLVHRLRSKLAEQTVALDIPVSVISKVCLETIKFEGDWMQHYTMKVQRILAT